MASQTYFDMLGGFKIPAVGLGTAQSADETILGNAIDVALEAGYRHIDTAFVYANEAVVGRVLKKWFSSGKLKREDIFLTTKLPLFGINKDRVKLFMKKSLENLQLDYVDLYLVHFPIGIKYKGSDDLSALEEMETEDTDHLAVWKKMEEQVDAGRTKAIGVSNFNTRQIERVIKSARIKPACLQVELHVYLQQRDLVQYCQRNGIVVVAYSPLGSPALNKFVAKMGKEPIDVPNILHDPVIEKIARNHNKTIAQVTLRYLLQKNVVAIPSSMTPSRIKENFNIFDFTLSAEEIKAMDKLDAGEKGRRLNKNIFGQLTDHPEWPFPK